MGSNHWINADRWPIPESVEQQLFLTSSTGAKSLDGDGSLSFGASISTGRDSFFTDPLNPVPTIGGQVLFPGENAIGPRDQRAAEERSDVLVFTSPMLDESLHVCGPVSVELWVSTDVPDADVTVKLTDVYPDGRSMLLTAGILRLRYRESLEWPELLEPGAIYQVTVDMWATANTFLPGHRVRMDIAGSNLPRWDRNTHSGNAIAFDGPGDVRIATTTIWHGPDHPSQVSLLVLPDPQGAGAADE